ncbi:hypothetical protein [Streptosporangium sp. NPDC051022]|uniref:hypothetical protein n=1 Tax=Streptosporangium sp. NPDC051022 TaxID=3155752 RepID=UPI003424D453
MPVTPGIYRLLGSAVTAISVILLAQPAAHAALPADATLPGTRVTVQENAGDPLTVSSYTLDNLAYLRRGGTFAKQSGYQEITVAPGGAKALAIPTSYNAGHDSVLLADLAAEKAYKVQTVQKPLVAHFAHWSRDGRKVVLTAQRKSESGGWATTGFVIVDAVAKTARTVTVPGVDAGARFRWTPDNAQLVAEYQGGTRFYGQDGAIRRTLAKTGSPAGGEDAFSPSGRGMMTWCPASYAEYVCVWDRVSGKLSVKVKTVRPTALLGWWDERSFIAVIPASNAYRAVLVDVQGRPLRVLAEISADDWNKKIYLSYTRS